MTEELTQPGTAALAPALSALVGGEWHSAHLDDSEVRTLVSEASAPRTLCVQTALCAGESELGGFGRVLYEAMQRVEPRVGRALATEVAAAIPGFAGATLLADDAPLDTARWRRIREAAGELIVRMAQDGRVLLVFEQITEGPLQAAQLIARLRALRPALVLVTTGEPPEGSKALRDAAAVLGQAAPIALLQELAREAGLDDASIRASLCWMLATGVLKLSPGEGYRLGRRAMTTCYAAIAPEQRQALHLSAAQKLEAQYGGADGPAAHAIGLHYDEAGERLKAAHFLCAAGRRWEALRFPLPRAFDALERSLGYCEANPSEETDALRVELSYQLACFALRRDEWEQTRAAIARYVEVSADLQPRARHEARVHYLTGITALHQAQHEEAKAALDALEESLQGLDADDPERAELEAHMVWGQSVLLLDRGRYDEATALMRRLMDYPDRSGRGGWVRARAWCTLAITSFTRGNVSRSAEEARRGRAEAQTAGAMDRVINALTIEANAEIETGALDVALRCAEEGVELGRSRGEMTPYLNALETLTHVQLELGRVTQAAELLDPQGLHARALARVEEFPWVAPLLLMLRGRIAAAQGQWALAIRQLRAAEGKLVERNDHLNVPIIRSMLARAYIETGDLDSADETARAAEDNARSSGRVSTVTGLLAARIALAQVALARGDTGECQRIAAQVHELAALRGLRLKSLRALALCLSASQSQPDVSQAHRWLERGQEVLSDVLGGLDPKLASVFSARHFAAPFS